MPSCRKPQWHFRNEKQVCLVFLIPYIFSHIHDMNVERHNCNLFMSHTGQSWMMWTGTIEFCPLSIRLVSRAYSSPPLTSLVAARNLSPNSWRCVCMSVPASLPVLSVNLSYLPVCVPLHVVCVSVNAGQLLWPAGLSQNSFLSSSKCMSLSVYLHTCVPASLSV